MLYEPASLCFAVQVSNQPRQLPSCLPAFSLSLIECPSRLHLPVCKVFTGWLPPIRQRTHNLRDGEKNP